MAVDTINRISLFLYHRNNLNAIDRIALLPYDLNS
jgi:hypothetical protein